MPPGPPKIQKVTKRSKKWRNGAKTTKRDETQTKSDETEQKVVKQTLIYGPNGLLVGLG